MFLVLDATDLLQKASELTQNFSRTMKINSFLLLNRFAPVQRSADITCHVILVDFRNELMEETETTESRLCNMDNILKVLFAPFYRSSTLIVTRNDCRYSNQIFLCIYRYQIDDIMRIFTGGGYGRISNNDAHGERLNLRNNPRV